jgi:PAS domain S-box-containing protein
MSDEINRLRQRIVQLEQAEDERQRVVEELRQSEARLRYITDSVQDAILMIDPQGAITFWNPAAEKLFGYTREEALGRNLHQLLAPERYLPQHLAAFPNFVRTGEGPALGQVHEMGALHRDGHEIAISLSLSSALLNGEWHGVGVIRDITRSKQAEQQLRMQAAALSASANAMVITTRDGAIVWINPAFTRLTGFTLEEVQGQNPRLLHSGVHPREFYQQMWASILAGKIWKGELVNRRQDGSLYYEEMTITPVLDDQGNITHFIGVKENITERKQWEAALEHEKAVLEQRVAERTAELSLANASLLHAVRVKDEFLASVSHELRTPLTGILGLSEILSSGIYGPLNEKSANALKNIEESGHHLLSLINDILDLSKAEAGMIDLDLRPLSATNLIQSALRLVRQSATKKEISIHLNLDAGAELFVADERRMKQILVNLLSNAIKFTPEKGSVGVDLVGMAEAPQLVFTVWDTGIGISEQDLLRLFRPFVQLDARLERQYSGTGLGLSLVLKLVELHGGSIRVESQVNAGSRFIVTLPWLRVEDFSWRETGQAGLFPHPILHLSPGVMDGKKLLCLVADDNETTLLMLSDCLDALGYRVLLARNGAEAIERAYEVHPDVILMDIQMPVMDGLSAIRLLRQDELFAATPVIALTALAMTGDRERILQAGANDYISKPVSLGDLSRLLQRLRLHQ